ncbi:hypothetical protein RvY_09991-2 [Ramazzottius varieornatus]|uniref:C2 domain-containing protein n=1 Tax=Ramazzottius varieornatus TaxID=947166 RepID=A0A1D1VBA6_RAMVA|nr:hypothetical protein RvY_09991-2 [Ramazzottius varieornatus]
MPATVKVKICEARNLPIMDRGGETTDAFVEVRLANNVFKTEVCRRTLDPKWDSDWFKFDVKDIELQEDPLQIRIMDYDTYSSHDAIGKIYVDLTNMLVSENRSSYTGWLPIYDTLLGIRGQLRIEIRLITFCVDMKSFWHPSQNVLFFASSLFPTGFHVKRIIGLVDHVIVADDPEHQWLIDKLRTPRSTNEARQLLFMKMSGELRRKIGGKVVDLGGNAVIALQQRIDLGNMGIILRVIGTAVVIEKMRTEFTVGETVLDTANRSSVSPVDRRRLAKVDIVPGLAPKIKDTTLRDGHESTNEYGNKVPGFDGIPENGHDDMTKFYLGSSQESDPPEGRTTSSAEFPFLTIKHFPNGLIKSLGGTVSCKLVKTLERVEQDDINQAPYALWWKEVRSEVFRLMKSIGCNAVIGYTEDVTLTDMGNIQLLCASGTAAVLDITLAVNDSTTEASWSTTLAKDNISKEQSTLQYPEMVGVSVTCNTFHSPSGIYTEHAAPTSSLCSVCRTGSVPDMLLLTIEPFTGMPIKGTGTLIQARVAVRRNRTFKGENGARELSEALPFVEFELHSQISTKLRLLGLNVVFGLKVDIKCGSEVIVALATGTGLYVTALPKPARLTVFSEKQSAAEPLDLQGKLDGLIEQQMRQLGLTDEKEDLKSGRPSRLLKQTPGHGKRRKTTGSRQYSKAGFIIDLEDDSSGSKDLLSLVDYLPSKETLLFGSEGVEE